MLEGLCVSLVHPPDSISHGYSEGMQEVVVGDPLDLENWYELLAEHTFQTTFLSLTTDELVAITDQHDKKRTTGLERVYEECHRLIDPEKGAFVRLSTRSAKDWALRAERTKKVYATELESISDLECDGIEDVRQVIAIIRAMSKALRVNSAEQIIEMLTFSERCYQDATRRVLNGGAPMQLVIRSWVPIQPELELRGFVFGKRFTCLSQYYKACYSPVLARNHAAIEQAALKCFKAIQKLLKLENFVLDLVYDQESDTCLVVELNHWARTTSSALFDWSTDIELLENGPFCFRFVAEPIPQVRSLIARPLREMAGWAEDTCMAAPALNSVSSSSVSPEIKAGKSRKVTRLIQRQAEKYEACFDASPQVDALLAVASRRAPAVFFTASDVSLLYRKNSEEKRFLRSRDSVVSAQASVHTSLYVCLLVRIVGGLPELERMISLCEQHLARLHNGRTADIALDINNALLVLIEMKLVTRKKPKVI